MLPSATRKSIIANRGDGKVRTQISSNIQLFKNPDIFNHGTETQRPIQNLYFNFVTIIRWHSVITCCKIVHAFQSPNWAESFQTFFGQVVKKTYNPNIYLKELKNVEIIRY